MRGNFATYCNISKYISNKETIEPQSNAVLNLILLHKISKLIQIRRRKGSFLTFPMMSIDYMYFF